MATAGTNLSAFNPEALPSAKPMRFALVVAEWNHEITDALYQGAKETLLTCGAKEKNIVKISVPGTVELTYAAKLACASETYDAVITIGVVIQGETKHFDFVCHSVTQGVTELNLRYSTPVIFCVLTDNNIQQSRDRSGGKHGNKGIEAAVAAIKMGDLKRKS